MLDLKPIHILLAEDNIDHAEMVMDALEDFNVGNLITHVTNGEEVLGYLRGEPPFDNPAHNLPNIILLDIKMPRMNGIAALAEIKSDPCLKSIPVIMISTSRTDQEIQHCYELGASSYITKPIRFEEFSRKIKDLNLYWVLTSELPSKKYFSSESNENREED